MSPYALLALLLQYPEVPILDAREEIVEAIRELAQQGLGELGQGSFVAWWLETPGWELQSAYVDTFDLGRRCSLYLTYPLLGDRRERGMALLRLKHRYALHGLELSDRELPDFLPVMLEYAASEPDGEALLAEHRVPLELLRAALDDLGSAYAAPVAAVCALLGPLSDADRDQAQEIAEHGPPMETVGLEPFAPPEVMPVDPTDAIAAVERGLRR
ncbi:MAG: nitrate reductase molybdenum cofactor assembly chaperone [Candidatus Dormibacteria bacterium]|jgi:nitrate reductase delta subunit